MRLAPFFRRYFSSVAAQQIVVSIYDAGQKLALDHNTCIRIRREAGHTNPGSPMCLADFTQIPDGLEPDAGVKRCASRRGIV